MRPQPTTEWKSLQPENNLAFSEGKRQKALFETLAKLHTGTDRERIGPQARFIWAWSESFQSKKPHKTNKLSDAVRQTIPEIFSCETVDLAMFGIKWTMEDNTVTNSLQEHGL